MVSLQQLFPELAIIMKLISNRNYLFKLFVYMVVDL